MKPVHVIIITIIAIIGIIIFLVDYSYSQIQFTLESISYQDFDFASPSTTTLFKLVSEFVTGNWMEFALTLVTGVKMSMVFGLSNHGIIPVYIPDVSFDVLINGIKIGNGSSHISSTINPGQIKSFQDSQDIKFANIRPAIDSIMASGGISNLRINGTAYFDLLGIKVPVQFQSSKQVNMSDEIKNHFSRYLSENQQPPQSNLGLSLDEQLKNSKITGTTVNASGNPLWNDFSHGTARLDDVDLDLEVGTTPELMQQGLQLQPKLPYDQGMLFMFRVPTTVPIWMPNMKFSIDVLWFDGNGNILHIEKNLPPCNLQDSSKCSIYGGKEKSQYVLEVTSGFVDKFNITTNSRLTNIRV